MPCHAKLPLLMSTELALDQERAGAQQLACTRPCVDDILLVPKPELADSLTGLDPTQETPYGAALCYSIIHRDVSALTDRLTEQALEHRDPQS